VVAITKQITAQDLVYTTNYVDGGMKVADVKGWFQTQQSTFSLGVVIGDGQFGLITRTHLAQELMNRDGDPLTLKLPISELMVPNALIADANREIETIINYLVETKGDSEDFYNDIIVRRGTKFVGLVSVRDLFLYYIESLTHRITAMDTQLAALAKKNRELFDNSFRLGKQETRFREIFDRTAVPMIVFSENGIAVAANNRFLHLTGHTAAGLDGKLPYRKFFQADFAAIQRELLVKLKDPAAKDESSVYQTELLTQSGSELPVEILADLTPDARHMIISIVQTSPLTPEPQPAILVAPSPDILEESSGKRRGRITQAIKMKLANSNTVGLARSVASNLIDRESEIDLLMRKLERVISVAEQVEKLQPNAAVVAAPSNGGVAIQSVPAQHATANHQHLQGRLADFSVIDLAQILVQGTKTGRLVLRDKDRAVLGSLYLYCGSIVHAETQDGAAGLDALPSLLRLREGEFEFLFDINSPVASISGDAMGILMDACRQMDERVAN
jgi:PAS domain S-box-containing protein